MPTSLLLFSTIVLLSLIALPALVSATRDDDAEASALLSFKSDLINPLDALHDWKPDNLSSHCNWTGVRCNAAGSVDALDLSRMNLSGTVTPGALLPLANLAVLNLCCNSFASSLPNTFPRFPALRELDVSDNSFLGGFPAGLSLSPALKFLNASGNDFVGPLPDDVGNATALETLDFRGGFFTGGIPLSYTALSRLRFLGLSGNNLTGNLPAELGLLSSLETLIIGYNGFDGSIPPELGNLTSLRYLDMAIGELTGEIPAELGKLSRLTTAYLYKNNLQGQIPREIGDITSLLFLDLSDNQLSGDIPADLGKLANLQLLNVMCNRLQGAVPAGIGRLPLLQVLELWNNSLTGPLPRDLGRNSSLQWLDVSSNSLSGELPAGLCDGRNLTKLILFNNAFSGPIPATLAGCVSLVRVRMHNNKMNGSIPAGFGLLPKLQRLELAGNDLTGEIPNDISVSTSLSFIDISHNHLTLSLPPNVLSVPSLQTFLAADNELVGGLPGEFQDCPSLATLDLSSNKLSNWIPASLASCERMVRLDLSGNRFTGEIPSAISMMPTLAILDLSNNLLRGPIPSSFGSLPALEMLNLSYNKLSGEVPENGMLRNINPDDLAGNSGLCGGVLPQCAGGGSVGSSTSSGLRGSHLKHIAAGWLAGISAVLAMGVVVVGVRLMYRRWYNGDCMERFGAERDGGGAWPWRLTAFQRLGFTSADVLACIKESNVIGMGATGIVYKAEVPQRQVVAVKKLWRAAEPPGAYGEFAGEAILLGRLRHRNIVRLLGYIHNEVETMIVYEYMPGGSLWDTLHGEQRGSALVDWVSRYNVAVGVAAGLAYLHHDCHPPVIHRDVKSSNILLDANLEARIADFGLAKLMVRKDETVSAVAGSYGYIAPEYGYTLKVDEKSDIYSFGVVLMELLTGRRPVDAAEFGEGQDVVGWVREKLRGVEKGAEEVLDGAVGGCRHVVEEMMLVLRVAVVCTARSPKERPSMRDVVTMLGEAKPRRKSSVTSVGSFNKDKDKPVFTTSPEPDYL